MQMVIRIAVLLVVFFMAIVILAPKKELYYLLEHRLEKQGIYLADEKLDSKPFGLKILHPRLLWKGAELGRAKELTVQSYLLYTSVEVENFVPAETLHATIPYTFDRITAKYFLFSPKRIRLNIEGEFGKAVGYFDLSGRRLYLEFAKLKNPETFRPYLKEEKGRWIYEKTF